MSVALVDSGDKQACVGPETIAWSPGKSGPAHPANDNISETSAECICESLVKDIERLKLERAATRQKLKRARRDTRRVRIQLSRLHGANRPSREQAGLRRVGETSLAEAVLAAQKKTARRLGYTRRDRHPRSTMNSAFSLKL
jgi:hypothetical protein